MNIIEKFLLIIIILAMTFFMLPTILGLVFNTISGEIQFIIIACFIVGIIAIPLLIIKHKED